MSVLTIDAGTTGVTALMVGEDGAVLSRGYQEFAQHYPDSGWVEHVPEEIWQATLAACQEAIDASGRTPTCLGITNQRETAVLWERRRGTAPRRAIVWQDRRTAGICTELREAGHEERVTELTGLRLDPYFTGTKLTWMARNDPRAWSGVESGDVAVGTVDSYVIARLTGGGRHVTDASNASRTLLYDIVSGAWSPELCELFGVPMEALPEVVPSYGTVGETSPEDFLGLRIPIAGIAGDQQAAMFGQNCYVPGSSKCTYGTGSFVLVNTGTEAVAAEHGLLSTVLWQHPDGHLDYALEGSIFVTGAAVQWLRDGLGLIDKAPQSEGLARSVTDSGGVVFVPALTGLGAPDWDPQARGAIFGITRGTGRAHLVRATLDAIAFEVRDVVAAMGEASGTELPELRVDGGASANNLLCQLQADQLGVSVARPQVQETTALGAAFLAGLGTGVWSSTEELMDTWKLEHRFEPGERDEGAYRRWREAVERSKGWAGLG
ncbi:glycerol kinase [Spinactinospora alkalitolerans]|uniref:glycerol kinase n=1 Tax=Spinactinospora alkalitolerans TaxID=687207 RepID=A0A852TXI6_9ACTN|nr:glycerol kinase GlpK [Spinactinospora alkalitolerans]NYE48719.1 glycerol kinase [Spinactinospora alkalitolerans]